jgi:hypothetical protein
MQRRFGQHPAHAAPAQLRIDPNDACLVAGQTKGDRFGDGPRGDVWTTSHAHTGCKRWARWQPAGTVPARAAELRPRPET